MQSDNSDFGPVQNEYSNKPKHYFSGARRPFVDSLPENPSGHLLEIGCGAGKTAEYARANRKCGWSVGVELCDGPAQQARGRMDLVITGDVEAVDLPFNAREFDVLIMSEVIEHIRDPWRVLRKLHPFLKPSCIVIAGSPNVAHYSILKMLLRGRWEYESHGIMDSTHLRWFTPLSYRKLFEDCGYEVQSVTPWPQLRPKARVANFLTFGALQHLLHGQIVLRARPKQDLP